MLAKMPREVPMPYKIYRYAEQRFIIVCKLGHVCLQAHDVASVVVSALPFYQVEVVHSNQSEKPRLALQPPATGLKQPTGIVC